MRRAGVLDRRAVRVAALAAALVGRSLGATTPSRPEIPEEFRSAPAVVLEDSRTVTTSLGRSSLSRRVRIQILDRKGFAQADQVIEYDAMDSKLADFEAHTVLPDGRKVPVPDALVRDVISFKTKLLEEHAVYISFPAVEVGSIVEWSYTVNSSEPSSCWRWEIQGPLPVLLARIVVHFPKEQYDPAPVLHTYSRSPIREYCAEDPSAATKRGVVGERICRNVPAFEDEALSPPEADVRLQTTVCLIAEGSDALPTRIRSGVNRAWNERLDRCTKRRDAVRTAAGTIVAANAAERAKIDAVYRYVRDKIVVRESSGVMEALSGDRPCQSPDDVLAGGGGSTDEVAFLMFALLQEAGVPVHLVVAANRLDGRFVATLPEPQQYGHLLLEVGSSDDRGYLDPSCRYCQAGVPDWPYTGAGGGGIRIANTKQELFLGGAVIGIGAAPAQFNVERVNQAVTLDPAGGGEVEGTIAWHAQADVEIRRRLEDLTDDGRADYVRRRLVGQIEDASVKLSDPTRLQEDFGLEFKYRAPDLGIPIAGHLVLRPPDGFTRRLPVPWQEQRKLPLWLPFPWSARTTTRFAIPAGFRVASVPADVVLEGAGMKFEAAWRETQGSPELVWTAQLTVSETSIPAAKYWSAREFKAGLQNALRLGAVLEPSDRSATEEKP